MIIHTGKISKKVIMFEAFKVMVTPNKKIIVKVDNNTNITINTTAVAGLAENVKGEELEQA